MTPQSRRDFLWQFGGGLGGIALTQLLAEASDSPTIPKPKPEFNGGLHHESEGQALVVQIFLNGGMSQPDTFDYKPELEDTASRSSRQQPRKWKASRACPAT
ncbi:MAG: hypothetical protein U0792_22680 [Gemmataceae bacterium]